MTDLLTSPPPVERVRRRAVWTIGDQIAASAQNFAIGLAVTHTVDLRGTGSFAVAFTLYQLLAAANRPLNADSLTIRYAAADPTTQRPAAAASTGGTIVFAVAAAAVCAAVGLSIPAPTGTALLALAVGIPAFLLQDSWRIVFLTSGRPDRSFWNNIVVLVLLLPACVVAHRIEPNSAAALVVAWGTATAVGAALGVVQARVWPSVRRAVSWWRETMHLGARMLGENAVASITGAAALFAIGSAAGLSELGRVRTAQVALGAVNSVLIAAMAIVVAEGIRMLADDPDRFPGLIRAVAAATAVVCAGAMVFWLVVPVGVGLDVIGSGWSDSRSLIVPCGLYLVALGLTFAMSGALRALRRPGEALRIRLIVAPFTIVASVIAAAIGGAGPAMAGIAAGEWVCVLLTVGFYRRTWRRWRAAPWDIAAPTRAPAGAL